FADERFPYYGLNLKEARQYHNLIKTPTPFTMWTNRDYKAVVSVLAEFGKASNLHELVSDRVLAKDATFDRTEEELQAYVAALYRVGQEEAHWRKMGMRIEAGENKRLRTSRAVNMIREYTSQFKDPLVQMKLAARQGGRKVYSDLADRFLVVTTAKVGYKNWGRLAYEVRHSPLFVLDWHIKTRSPEELGRRVDSLLRAIEKEKKDKEPAAAGKKPRKS
ncbi:hypothetical protein KIPB_013330, partial [Kipferlia bialata]